MPFNTPGLSTELPFTANGLPARRQEYPCRNWETLKCLSKGNDPHRKLHYQDEGDGTIHPGMPTCGVGYS